MAQNESDDTFEYFKHSRKTPTSLHFHLLISTCKGAGHVAPTHLRSSPETERRSCLGFWVFYRDITAGLREMSAHHQCGICHMEFADESKISTGWLCGGHLPSAGEG